MQNYTEIRAIYEGFQHVSKGKKWATNNVQEKGLN